MAMCTSAYGVQQPAFGLRGATESPTKKPAAGWVVQARHLTVVSWVTYPGVSMFKACGSTGAVGAENFR